MTLHHVICKGHNIWGRRSESYLTEVKQVAEDVSAKSITDIPEQVDSLGIELCCSLDYFVQ